MTADVVSIRRGIWAVSIVLMSQGWAIAGDPDDPARVKRAIAYLDARQDEWSQFSKAQRGEGADKTACVSCHSGLGYVLARPALGPFTASPAPATPTKRINAAVALRVAHRDELDSPRFELMYDFEDRKKVESRGTEAVFNALILARDDASQGRAEPSPTTRTALQHLWATQSTEGENAGSWDWLNFGLEPWEANNSRVFGAALAAIAATTVTEPAGKSLDDPSTRGRNALRDYLRRRFPDERIYNRLWILEASTTFEGLLTAEQKKEVVDQLLALRRDDGGWSLATLGDFKRVDGTTQPRDSDGHATGLVLHALLRTGTPATRPEITQGLAWIRSHQQEDGSWPGRSLNKERDPKTFIGHLMIDSATAMAALALVEAGSK